MILCHLCGLLFLPPLGVAPGLMLTSARDHALIAHPDRFGDCTFSDVWARPDVLLREEV